MIRINQIIFTLPQIANGDTLLLTDILPVKEFIDGKSSDKIIGFRYTCVCPLNKYEQITIRVEETKPVITNEELSAKGAVKIKPRGFEGRFYKDGNSGEYRFTGKATAIEVVA